MARQVSNGGYRSHHPGACWFPARNLADLRRDDRLADCRFGSPGAAAKTFLPESDNLSVQQAIPPNTQHQKRILRLVA